MSTHNLSFEQTYEKYLGAFIRKFFSLLEVKFSIYLNRRAFVMCHVFFSECLGRAVLRDCDISWVSLLTVFLRHCGLHDMDLAITKTRLYNFDPLQSHFYIVKLWFTEYTLFFLFLLKNIDCGYSLEPLRRDGSNECPQFMF